MANPSLVVPVGHQTVTKGQVVALSVTQNIVDPDAQDRLAFFVLGLPVGSGLAMNEDTGVLSGTPTAADIAAVPMSLTLGALAAGNVNIIGSFTLELDAVGEEPTVGASFYVSSTATGSGDGSLLNPYTPSQAALITLSSIVPTPTTHVYCDWEPGNYDNKPYVPRYGGLSTSVMLKHRVRTAGVVRFRGPQTGTGINYGVELRFGIYAGQNYSADFMEFEREADRNFEIDGQAVAGASAGMFGKGEAPESVAKLRRGALVESRFVVFDMDMTRTAGWNGLEIGTFADNNVYRVNYVQHGTPFYPDGNDFGDMFWVSQQMQSTKRHLIDADA